MQLSDIHVGDWLCDPEALPYNSKYHYDIFKVIKVTKTYILFNEYYFTDIYNNEYCLIRRDYEFDVKRLKQEYTTFNRDVKISSEEATSIIVKQIFDKHVVSIKNQGKYSDF